MIEEMREIAEEAVERCMENRTVDWNHMKTAIKDRLEDYLWQKIKRNPIILPIIMEVEV